MWGKIVLGMMAVYVGGVVYSARRLFSQEHRPQEIQTFADNNGIQAVRIQNGIVLTKLVMSFGWPLPLMFKLTYNNVDTSRLLMSEQLSPGFLNLVRRLHAPLDQENQPEEGADDIQN